MGQNPWRARLLAVGLGVLLLFAAELAARLLLGAPQAELLARVPTDSSAMTRQEGDTLLLLYQQDSGTAPIPLAPQGRRRVVWLGGSSIHGGNPGMSIDREAAHVAGRRLGADTVNMAAPGLDTNHHLSLLPDVLALSPAAVVLYAGHNDLGNEVLLARYSGGRFQRVARLRWLLRHSRIFTALEGAVRQRAVLRLPDKTTTNRFTVDAELRATIHAAYRRNVSAIVSALQEAGIIVVLATPASNPVTPSMEWRCPDALAQLGLQGLPPEAFPVSHLKREAVAALQAEADCADLRWLLARLDQDTAALEALRDADPLPFRADRALVQLVRDLADEHGAVLADSNARFRELGGGIEHPALFNDPMHFSERGHQVLGDAVAEALAEPLGRRLAPAEPLRIPPMDLAGCGDMPCRTAPPPPGPAPR